MNPFKVSEVIILVFLTQTISVTLPLIDKTCKEPRCYAENPTDANRLGISSDPRYLRSCNAAYQGLPEPMPPLTNKFHPFDCMEEGVQNETNGRSQGIRLHLIFYIPYADLKMDFVAMKMKHSFVSLTYSLIGSNLPLNRPCLVERL